MRDETKNFNKVPLGYAEWRICVIIFFRYKIQAGRRVFLASTMSCLVPFALDPERLPLDRMNTLIVNVWNNSFVSETCSPGHCRIVWIELNTARKSKVTWLCSQLISACDLITPSMTSPLERARTIHSFVIKIFVCITPLNYYYASPLGEKRASSKY